MAYRKVFCINAILFLILLQLTSFAQDESYEPILKEGNVWTSGCINGFWDPFTTYSVKKFKAKGDTTIFGVNYHKIYWHYGETAFVDSLAQYYCAAREDGPKLYLRPPDSDQDLLHLDISATTGDILTVYSGVGFHDVKVLGVGETEAGKKYVYLERLNCYGEDYPYQEWIEGIGSTRSFYDEIAACESFDGCYEALICLEDGDTTSFQLGVDCNYVYEFSGNFYNIEDTTICLGQSVYFEGIGVGGLSPYSMYAIPQTDEDTIINGFANYYPSIVLQPSETTSYTFYMQDHVGNLDSTEITISVNPDAIKTPEIKFDFPSNECEVDSLLLYIEGDYTNIWWTDYYGLYYGVENSTVYGTDSTLLITEAQSYYVIVENNSGCREHDRIGFSNTIDIKPDPIIITSGIIYNGNNCSGDVVKIWTTKPFVSYLWETGETTDTIEMIIKAGSHAISTYVDVTDENGCVGRDDISINTPAIETPEMPVISFDGAKLIASPTSPYLQWYLDSEPIEGATDSIFYPFHPGIYTVEAKTENGVCSIFSDEFYFEGFELSPELYLKVNLEGPYNKESAKMRTSLLELNLLPLKQPYNGSPYNYNGEEQINNYENFPNNTVDWILVEIGYLANDAFVVYDRKAGLLLSDGKIVNTENFKNIRFESLENNFEYHIKIRHRNHLDITSSYGLEINATMSYDFQKQITSALGISQLNQLVDGEYGMITGNYLKDQVIQTTDYDFWFESQTNQAVYHNADGNLDGKVDLLDYELWQQNRAKLEAR